MEPDEILEDYFNGDMSAARAISHFNDFSGNTQGRLWLAYNVRQRDPSTTSPPSFWIDEGRIADPVPARDLEREVAEEETGIPVDRQWHQRPSQVATPEGAFDEAVADRKQAQAERGGDGGGGSYIRPAGLVGSYPAGQLEQRRHGRGPMETTDWLRDMLNQQRLINEDLPVRESWQREWGGEGDNGDDSLGPYNLSDDFNLEAWSRQQGLGQNPYIPDWAQDYINQQRLINEDLSPSENYIWNSDVLEEETLGRTRTGDGPIEDLFDPEYFRDAENIDLAKALYMKRLGISDIGQSRYQKWLMKQFMTPYTEFMLRGAGLLGGLAGGNDMDFRDYLAQREGPMSRLQGDFMGAILDMEPVEQFGLFDLLGGGGTGAVAQRVYQGALRDQSPGWVAQGRAAQAFDPNVIGSFDISQAALDTENLTSFLSYLRDRFLPNQFLPNQLQPNQFQPDSADPTVLPEFLDQIKEQETQGRTGGGFKGFYGDLGFP